MVSVSYKYYIQAVCIGLFFYAPVIGYAQEQAQKKEQIQTLPPTVIAAKELQERFAAFDMDAHTIDYDTFMAWHGDEGTQTVILDLRALESFEYAHIEGAKHLGADIDEVKLEQLVPSKGTRIVLYCSNSLHATRTISLTNMSLPQLHMLGYKNSYMLGPIWDASGSPPDDFPMVKQ